MLSSNKNNYLGILLLLVAACSGNLAVAQSAPGEDPISLQGRVSYQMLPLGGAPKSSSINFSTDIPAWQKARIARYEAKAFSGNKGDILTEKDVVNTATSDGFKTTCTQSIGSTAAPTMGIVTGAGVKPTQQVVVLRGDLVNICN
jgi:hypothetical protein